MEFSCAFVYMMGGTDKKVLALIIEDEKGDLSFPGTVEGMNSGVKQKSFDMFGTETGLQIGSYRFLSVHKHEDPNDAPLTIGLIDKLSSPITANFLKVVEGKTIRFEELNSGLAEKMKSVFSKLIVRRADQLAKKGD